MSRRQVAIVQPYVPSYRRPLFESLQRSLDERGIDLVVIAGTPDPVQQRRNDAIHLDFQRDVGTHHLNVRGRSLRWKKAARHVRSADLVICELASGALETYVIWALRRGRLALWGHGYAATSAPSRIDTALESWLMRRSRRIFAYTERGREAAVRAGVADDRITVLRNTVDTSELAALVESLTDAEVGAFAEAHDLVSPNVCVSIGGLDESKRLDVLIEAGRRIASDLPDFRLAVGGDGALRDQIVAAADRHPWLVYLGRVGEREKALLARCGQLLLNPGRVGLIAVESFVMGLPIVTIDWPNHAPEAAYLTPDRTAVFTDDDPAAFADEVVAVLRDRERLSQLRAACSEEATSYSMDSLVQRFSDGIEFALR